MPFATRMLAAAVLMSLPAAASAHRQWLLPNATVFSGTDSWVTVDAASSNDLFLADHQPIRLDWVKAWAPDGSEARIENGATGRYRSTFDVKLDKPGTWKIGTMTTMVVGSFKLNGEERRVGRSGGGPGMPSTVSVADIPAEATEVKLTELVGRNEIFVTAGAPSTGVFKPSGKGLELEPVTHPDELVTGEPASFRFLVDGKPAPSLKVTVVPGGKRYRNDDGARDFTTDADGVVRVDWPAAGMYWINASLTDGKVSDVRAGQRRMNYMTTVEVLLP